MKINKIYKNKNCLKCGLEYSPNSSTQKYCVPCKKEYRKKYHKKYWKNHPELKKERTKRNYINYRKKRAFVLNYKTDKCCPTCGYKEHPEILQFHHKNKSEKRYLIANSLTQLSLKNIKLEINKCILLCPNCHFWYHLKNQKNK